MQFDFTQLDGTVAYKLMTATVTPRPIAWIVSQDAQGRRNVAPFSFFNAVSGNPPVLAIGITARASGQRKDTLSNVLETRQFSVNLVNEALAPQMNITAVEFDPDVDESVEAGLELTDCNFIKGQRLAESPVSFECELLQEVMLAPHKAVILARVLGLHVADTYILDAQKGYIDTPSLQLVGRMHGSGWYTRTRDLFQLDRLTVDEWQARKSP